MYRRQEAGFNHKHNSFNVPFLKHYNPLILKPLYTTNTWKEVPVAFKNGYYGY